MALRARRRQGGGSSGTQHNNPNNPNRSTTGIGSTSPPRASTNPVPKPVKPKLGPAFPAAAPRPVVTPSATYIKPPPPAPTPATRGASSEALRADATTRLGIAGNQNRDAIYRAIMNLGDPTVIAQMQADPRFTGYQFTQDPNSLFSSLARQEQKGLEDIDVNANVGNTFFSGMRLRDRGELTDETGRQRLAGSTDYEDSLKDYAASLGLSQADYNKAMRDADQMDIEAALERDRIARDEWEKSQGTLQQQTGTQAPPASQPGYTTIGTGGISTGNTTLQGVGGLPSLPVPAGNIYGPTIVPTTPKPGYTHVASEGSRTGLSYNVVMKNGKRYKFYENGDKVEFP